MSARARGPLPRGAQCIRAFVIERAVAAGGCASTSTNNRASSRNCCFASEPAVRAVSARGPLTPGSHADTNCRRSPTLPPRFNARTSSAPGCRATCSPRHAAARGARGPPMLLDRALVQLVESLSDSYSRRIISKAVEVVLSAVYSDEGAPRPGGGRRAIRSASAPSLRAESELGLVPYFQRVRNMDTQIAELTEQMTASASRLADIQVRWKKGADLFCPSSERCGEACARSAEQVAPGHHSLDRPLGAHAEDCGVPALAEVRCCCWLPRAVARRRLSTCLAGGRRTGAATKRTMRRAAARRPPRGN